MKIIFSALLISALFTQASEASSVHVEINTLPCEAVGRMPRPIGGARFELVQVLKSSPNARYAPQYLVKAIPIRSRSLAFNITLVPGRTVNEGYRYFVPADEQNRFGISGVKIFGGFERGRLLNKYGTVTHDCNARYNDEEYEE